MLRGQKEETGILWPTWEMLTKSIPPKLKAMSNEDGARQIDPCKNSRMEVEK